MTIPELDVFSIVSVKISEYLFPFSENNQCRVTSPALARVLCSGQPVKAECSP